MHDTPRVGSVQTRTFTVEPGHTIDFGHAELPAVLSTPSLIWFLEHTALDHVRPCLDEGEITVGVRVELDHLAAAVVGTQVTCRSRVIHVEGPAVTFQIEASAGTELLGRGLHRRRAVRIERLAARLRQPAAG